MILSKNVTTISEVIYVRFDLIKLIFANCLFFKQETLNHCKIVSTDDLSLS